jgi:hypothetical protein
MSLSRPVALLTAALLLVPAGALALAGSASAATSKPAKTTAKSSAKAKAKATPAIATLCGKNTEIPEVGSVDGDEAPDVMAGLSGFTPDRIDLHLTAIGTQRVDDTDFPGMSAATGFGASMATMDLNHDGCSELIVGAPDLQTQPVTSQVGAVEIFTGSRTGLSATGFQELTTPSDGDGFGSAVAVASRTNSPTDVSDLWIGAPDRTVEGKAEAGAVDHYVVSADGVPTFSDTVTADTTGIGGVVNAGAHFGQVLSAQAGEVLIGAPDDTVSHKAGAGSATVGYVDDFGHVTSGHFWTQDKPGVPGSAEVGDHFGAAVYDGDGFQAVGVPGEDIGTVVDAGIVQLFQGAKASSEIDQGTVGVPGIIEAGDRFGASVAMGVWLSCQETGDLAVGSPGEDVGKIVDAGTVTLIPLPGSTGCASQLLTQGTGGLNGSIEKGDQVGATLSILRGRDDFDEDDQDALMIGVPFEDLGAVVDAGVVLVHTPGHTTSYGYSEGAFHNTDFGRVLANPGGGPMTVFPDVP